MRLSDGAKDFIPELSVIVPVFNEADSILELLDRLNPIVQRSVSSYEIIFIDDGSTDETLTIARRAHELDGRLVIISLSRNFGKEVAIAAGLDSARGKAAVIMDADLQHPPEMIETFVEYWRNGYQNVYGQRVDRNADTPLRRALTHRFYSLFRQFGEIELPPGAGDYRLLDRCAINALIRMREHARFSKGLYAWIGFKSIGVPFEIAPRSHGRSKFSYRKLTRFALDGIMSFSTIPLMVWTFIGVVVSVFALSLAIYFLTQTLLYGSDVPGFATLIVSVGFFSGIQLLSLGVLGEYIGRIFAEVKGRPLYLIAEKLQNDPSNAADVSEPMLNGRDEPKSFS